MTERTRAAFRRWEPDGTRHVISIVEKKAGAPYEVRLDGQFYATADTVAQAGDEARDICQSMGLLYRNPLAG